MGGSIILFQTDRAAILLAAYNGERFIGQQLDSILAQSCPDWELFIHDDGSRDATPAILAKYAAACPDKIHLIEAPSTGSAKGNFLFLMQQVDAPYYLFCDQDDVWNKDKLENSLSALNALEAERGTAVPLLVFSDSAVADSELHVISESFLSYQGLDPRMLRFSELMVQNVVSGNASVINRSLCQYALRYTDADAIIMHDWWCALVAAYFGSIGFISESTLLYRQHGGNTLGAKKYFDPKYMLSLRKPFDMIRERIAAVRRQAGEFAKAFALGADSLPARFASAGELSKCQRIRFYRKNSLRKPGMYRTLGFYFFG